jgi:predicted dehydrogenase
MAGKHIFCEQPMATDAPGVRSVQATVAEAKRKNLALVTRFCWRYNLPERALFPRIHARDIGAVRMIYCTYYTGLVKPVPPASDRTVAMTDLEWQLRNWSNFCWLLGGSLVEQAVHAVDCIQDFVKHAPDGGADDDAGEDNVYLNDHMNRLKRREFLKLGGGVFPALD